ncbi:CrcB family protein [Microbacterium aurantiacum]|uniref:CrcB family protein n=1 Tax=Microbacterium aurantiacum TaxID=162393 RepID=UPI001FE82F04|nr:CrcB family protein [Microbacterium aurantiacum]
MNLRRVLLVAAGGTAGTAARLGLGLVIPDAGGFPVAVLVANLLGALLIGILTARLPKATEMRLFLGTGLLGGFTTYSAFMTGTVGLWADAPLLAVAYAVGSLVLGLAAATLGLRIGRPRAGAAS